MTLARVAPPREYFNGLLAGSVLAGAWVIFPTGIFTNAARGPGLVDQYRIAQHESAAEYVTAIERADQSEYVRQLKELAYDYSRTHDRKYRWLRRLVVVSAVGWLAAAVSCLALSMKRAGIVAEQPMKMDRG